MNKKVNSQWFFSKANNRNLKVITHGGKYYCFQENLEALDSQLSAMLSHHSKVLVIRIDLHTHEFSECNEMMSRFLRVFKKRLKANYKFKRIGYAWCRETEKAKKQHYHLALMLDGHKVQYPAKIIELAKEIWEGREYGHIPVIPRPYHNVQRDDEVSYDEAFERMTYLAKVRGKGVGENKNLKSKYANNFSSSRIKPKVDLNSIVIRKPEWVLANLSC